MDKKENKSKQVATPLDKIVDEISSFRNERLFRPIIWQHVFPVVHHVCVRGMRLCSESWTGMHPERILIVSISERVVRDEDIEESGKIFGGRDGNRRVSEECECDCVCVWLLSRQQTVTSSGGLRSTSCRQVQGIRFQADCLFRNVCSYKSQQK